MKNYFNTILIVSLLLLIFPFLAFPEIIENIYVAVLAFIIGYTSLLLRHKLRIDLSEDEEETSLQDYVRELRERFSEKRSMRNEHNNIQKRVSAIQLDEE